MLREASQSFFRFIERLRDPVAGADPPAHFVLERRSLYILPTREGLYYGAMLGVILVAAVNYSSGLAYALAFLLAAIAVVAILHTHRNVSQLRLSAGSSPPVFAGESARFTIIAHNDGDIARRAVDVSAAGQTCRFDVPEHGTTAIDLTVPTTRRGYLAAPPMTFRTRFPLGLWRAWSRAFTLSSRCMVYPRPAVPQPLPETPGMLTGAELSRNTESEDFAGLREYRQGDPAQRVAWKKVAAGQGWYTKQFVAPAGQVTWLEWNRLPSMGDEGRLSLLCRWVLMAEQQGIAYGMSLPSFSVAPDLGASHRDRCLERLALYEPPP
jgi:uncharacterized protein (DUF58 family)